MRSLRAFSLLLGIMVNSPTLAAQTEARTEDSTGAEGVLRPGDLVRLSIWREPDLSGEFQVHENGEIVFPKIGPLRVTDYSPESLHRSLLSAYSVYLRNPSIEITLLRRVQVLGAVRNPGLYPVDPTMTLADVVAKAGGSTPQGNVKKFELRRGGERITGQFGADTRVTDTPLRSGDQIFIPERPWISRNSWVIVAGLSATTSILVAVLR
jgi:polysaccharide export outer membrane protein